MRVDLQREGGRVKRRYLVLKPGAIGNETPGALKNIPDGWRELKEWTRYRKRKDLVSRRRKGEKTGELISERKPKPFVRKVFLPKKCHVRVLQDHLKSARSEQ